MMTEPCTGASPRGLVSPLEEFADHYPSWTVARQASGMRVGQWVATHPDVADPLTAITADRMLLLLEGAELERFKARWHREWVVWRSQGGSWMASARLKDAEPTLMCDSPAELEERMANPRRWGGRAPKPRRSP